MKTSKYMKVGYAAAASLLLAGSASALSLSVDQVIYQNGAGVVPGLLNGTVDVTSSGSTLTILLRNTSPDGAFTVAGSPALMLLTGVGLQLPGVNITGGSVSVDGGSSAINFDVGQSAVNIANQWGYANSAVSFYNQAGVLAVDSIVSSMQQGGGQTRFAGAPPVTIDGPGYGAISALETQFGTSTPGISDTIRLVLNLSGTAPLESVIDSGNVVLAFGSPTDLRRDAPHDPVPEGGMTVGFLGIGLLVLGCLRRNLAK